MFVIEGLHFGCCALVWEQGVVLTLTSSQLTLLEKERNAALCLLCYLLRQFRARHGGVCGKDAVTTFSDVHRGPPGGFICSTPTAVFNYRPPRMFPIFL